METYREETQRQKEKRMRGRRGGEINEERQLEEEKNGIKDQRANEERRR